MECMLLRSLVRSNESREIYRYVVTSTYFRMIMINMAQARLFNVCRTHQTFKLSFCMEQIISESNH